MHELKIETLNRHTCQILSGPQLLKKAGALISNAVSSSRAVMVTDSNVGPLYAQQIIDSLSAEGTQVEVITIPAGEENKTLATASGIYNTLAAMYIDRGNPLIALGGGMIGDLAGFVGATYLRGLPLIQIATSLVAQVDSSIGGKVAVNHENLKNQIGTFYQPFLVLSDSSCLKTLPEDEFINGLGEVIKSALIMDEELFNIIENGMELIKSRNEKTLDKVIFRSARVKTSVVEKDEKDKGLRQILNFGHTIGHAIETCSDFNISHGRAVAIGMVLASKASQLLGLLSQSDYERIKNLIRRSGLPVTLPDVKADDIIDVIKHDKKIKGGKINFILLTNPGAAVISSDVTPEIIKEVITAP